MWSEHGIGLGLCHSKLSPWVKFFTSYSSALEGYVLNRSQLELLLEDYELETHSYFIVVRSRHFYGKELDGLGHVPKIHWFGVGTCPESQLNPGLPYVIMGTRTLGCHHGFLKNKIKGRMKLTNEESVITKKCGCPAKIDIRHIVTFPDYKCSEVVTSRHKRVSEREKVSEMLKNGKCIVSEDQFFVKLPSLTDHDNHRLGELGDSLLPIDRRLVEYIHEKVQQDTVYNTQQMKSLLADYVTDKLFVDRPVPPKTNRRYWPQLHQIRNHMGFNNARDKSSTTKNKIKVSPENDHGKKPDENQPKPMEIENKFPLPAATNLSTTEDQSPPPTPTVEWHTHDDTLPVWHQPQDPLHTLPLGSLHADPMHFFKRQDLVHTPITSDPDRPIPLTEPFHIVHSSQTTETDAPFALTDPFRIFPPPVPSDTGRPTPVPVTDSFRIFKTHHPPVTPLSMESGTPLNPVTQHHNIVINHHNIGNLGISHLQQNHPHMPMAIHSRPMIGNSFHPGGNQIVNHSNVPVATSNESSVVNSSGHLNNLDVNQSLTTHNLNNFGTSNGMDKITKALVNKVKVIENLVYMCEDPDIGRNALNTLRRLELLLKKGCPQTTRNNNVKEFYMQKL